MLRFFVVDYRLHAPLLKSVILSTFLSDWNLHAQELISQVIVFSRRQFTLKNHFDILLDVNVMFQIFFVKILYIQHNFLNWSSCYCWKQVLNLHEQSGRFNFSSEFLYYHETLYKRDFSNQRKGKPVIFDMDMSAGDFISLIYLLKVPAEVLDLKVTWI